MNNHTLLLRQVHPQFISNEAISSQAFFPFPKDAGKLSVYNKDLITAEEAHRHYTAQGLASVGVWAVNGGEVESVGLAYRPDPVVGNDAHAVIDFGNRTENEYRKLAKRLKKFANDRGCLFRAG